MYPCGQQQQCIGSSYLYISSDQAAVAALDLLQPLGKTTHTHTTHTHSYRRYHQIK